MSVRQCAAVRQCVAVCAAVCGSAGGCVRQCVAVSVAVYGNALYVHVHEVAHNMFIGMPLHKRWWDWAHIPRIFIQTDQYNMCYKYKLKWLSMNQHEFVWINMNWYADESVMNQDEWKWIHNSMSLHLFVWIYVWILMNSYEFLYLLSRSGELGKSTFWVQKWLFAWVEARFGKPTCELVIAKVDQLSTMVGFFFF
jgi:hypothetical protein